MSSADHRFSSALNSAFKALPHSAVAVKFAF